jgi:hypothetical protein
MPTPVDGRANLHTAACYGQPLGARCRSFKRRALVSLDVIAKSPATCVLQGCIVFKSAAVPPVVLQELHNFVVETHRIALR